MKVKAIVSLLALAVAGVAHAGVNTSLNNSEIYLAVYDTAATKSFLFNTGVNASSLINGSINVSFDFGSDATWNSFVSSVGGIDNLNWGVQAIQFQNGVNTKYIYSTLGAGAAVGPLGTNGAFNSQLTNMNNALQNAQVTAGTSEVAAVGTATYFGDIYDGYLADGVVSTSNKLNVGDVAFFGVANSNTAKPTFKNTLLATPTVFANFNTQSGHAVLTIGQPVPEPTGYALFLAGLAGVGFVARRRAK